MKFRKKPVVIEAEQFTEDDIKAYLLGGVPLPKGVFHGTQGNESVFFLRTIHAGQEVIIHPGDWIIPEPDGIHFYPCKPDIFEATYESVE